MRRWIGWGLIGVGLVVLFVGTLHAMQTPGPVVEAIPGWLSGGLGVSLVGSLITYGSHKEFKHRASRDIETLQDDVKERVTHKGLEDAMRGIHQRFDDLRELVLEGAAERRGQRPQKDQ